MTASDDFLGRLKKPHSEEHYIAVLRTYGQARLLKLKKLLDIINEEEEFLSEPLNLIIEIPNKRFLEKGLSLHDVFKMLGTLSDNASYHVLPFNPRLQKKGRVRLENIQDYPEQPYGENYRAFETALERMLEDKALKMEFSEEKSCIFIGGKEVPVPPFKNEYDFCKFVINQRERRKVMDWEEAYEAMGGEINEKDRRALSYRKVQRVIESLNERISSKLNMPGEKFFSWKARTFQRLY